MDTDKLLSPTAAALAQKNADIVVINDGGQQAPAINDVPLVNNNGAGTQRQENIGGGPAPADPNGAGRSGRVSPRVPPLDMPHSPAHISRHSQQVDPVLDAASLQPLPPSSFQFNSNTGFPSHRNAQGHRTQADQSRIQRSGHHSAQDFRPNPLRSPTRSPTPIPDRNPGPVHNSNTDNRLSQGHQEPLHHTQYRNGPSLQAGQPPERPSGQGRQQPNCPPWQAEQSYARIQSQPPFRQDDRQFERPPSQQNRPQPGNFPQQCSAFGLIERWWTLFIASRASYFLQMTMMGLWIVAKTLEIGIFFGILLILNMTIFPTRVQPSTHLIFHHLLQNRLVWSLFVVFLMTIRLLTAMIIIFLTDFTSILYGHRSAPMRTPY